ncbi:MAG: RsmG family class I SAM-dependent methyltransferase [Blastocatellia bacterium]
MMKNNSVLQIGSIIEQNQSAFGIQFTSSQINQLISYFQLVLKWNSILHLTTLSTPVDFALLNILESAFATTFFSPRIKCIFDLGSGYGIPGIPIGILRNDLPVTLIEASHRKAIFLKEAISILGLHNLQVLNQRFELCPPLDSNSCIVARAMEKMTKKLPDMLHLGGASGQFLFWGNSHLLALVRARFLPFWNVDSLLIPLSEKRLLVSITRST